MRHDPVPIRQVASGPDHASFPDSRREIDRGTPKKGRGWPTTLAARLAQLQKTPNQPNTLPAHPLPTDKDSKPCPLSAVRIHFWAQIASPRGEFPRETGKTISVRFHILASVRSPLRRSLGTGRGSLGA